MAILIATFRRPDGLETLLRALGTELASVPFDAEVIVADNDPAQTGQPAFARAATDLPCPARYLSQPTPGIAHTRNALLDASEAADLLVFIDDDELPRPNWLTTLVTTAERLGADVLTGPVLYDFEGRASTLVASAPCFRPRRQVTGTPDPWPKTGNVLIRTEVLGRSGMRFPERYSMTGGSDTAFFAQLASIGSRPIWCDEAVVVERVPPERTTMGYALRRGVRVGNTTALVERDFGRGPARLLIRAGKAAGVAVRGVAMVVAGVIRRRPDLISRGAYDVARAHGMALGLAGHRTLGYRRPA